jgi:hypothetical protein
MSDTPQDPFEKALAALLAPLSRAMMARGVTYGSAAEALKRAMLQAALDQLAAEGGNGRISDSKISLMTGLHRKDVKRLRDDSAQCEVKRTVSAAAMVISYWATAPDYLDNKCCPRRLTRAADDAGPGFDDLVRQARIDMAPGTVLQALIEQGAVAEEAEGVYCLKAHTLLPAGGGAEQVAAYEATLSAHLAAATDNLLAPPEGPRHFDRAVRYSHLSEASVEHLRKMSAAKAQELLEEINAEARKLQEADEATQNDADPKRRFVLGAYILPAPLADKTPSTPEDTE